MGQCPKPSADVDQIAVRDVARLMPSDGVALMLLGIAALVTLGLAFLVQFLVLIVIGRVVVLSLAVGRSTVRARNKLADLLGGVRGVGRNGHPLVDGPPLRCISNGSAGGSREGASCRTPAGVDLCCAMVRSGYALRWKRHGGDQVCR